MKKIFIFYYYDFHNNKQIGRRNQRSEGRSVFVMIFNSTSSENEGASTLETDRDCHTNKAGNVAVDTYHVFSKRWHGNSYCYGLHNNDSVML